ncbi:PKD domain-containing protein [Vallicoccus soli]|uniref:PKD domain-containing protein n=1 Tax=Vallicoccus soli TaxID=2339232 RepID=A0A3A3Z0S0_9ACTN|nr:PKD domain-containing protein [Vallicoccus soli]RJK97849.1 PKD domain-containing protein [Vallicoccus soli]
MNSLRRAAGAALAGLLLPLTAVAAPAATAGPAAAAQPVPAHGARLVPDKPRADTPRILDGEIWDIEVVPRLDRAFVAGSFTRVQDTRGTTTVLNQAGLLSFDLSTGLLDRGFRPTFDGAVSAVEATPDGTGLFVAGSFGRVGGVQRQKVARLDLATGAPVAAFDTSRSTNNQATALAATDTTLYVGGRFTRVNGAARTGLAALSTATGAVDPGFDNSISGGTGVGGTLTVQQLELTHDDRRLVVVHTGRQVAGQDRLAVAMVDTATKRLLPWRTRLWDENLARVGGVVRAYAADVAPDDTYFVVASGSGGDTPPVNDTVVAYPLEGGDDVRPLWVHRAFDSIYSVAVSESAVYLGGHFSWNESPTADVPWPGLDDVGYGTGQGLSGYGLGDQVVRRDHIGALDPRTGTALEWNPGSTSFEGNKAMEVTPRGLLVGGDGMFQGGVRTGRVAVYDFATVPAPALPDTTIAAPLEGRVLTAGTPTTLTGTATVAAGRTVREVQVEVQDRDTKQFLQDDLVTWGAANTLPAVLGAGTTSRPWSLPLTLTGNHALQVTAKAVDSRGSADRTKAVKKAESFSFDDQTPATSVTGPSGVQTTTTLTLTGTATDDRGVTALTYWFRDAQGRYLQPDGSLSEVYSTFRGQPDVVGATSATWSYEVTLPHEGVWRASATAIDTAGQADLRSATRDITVDATAVAPVVAVEEPVAMVPPFTVPAVAVQPGAPLRLAGTATDDTRVRSVEVSLRNSTTGEVLAADGSWGTGLVAGWHRVSPADVAAVSYRWAWTTPALSPGTYSFAVRATDDEGLVTATAGQGRLTLSATVPGDAPPDGLLAVTGTQVPAGPHLDLAGTASDDKGVAAVQVRVLDDDTGRYLKADGSFSSGAASVPAVLAAPGATSTAWSLPVDLPGAGDYRVTVLAVDTAGQQDPSGATATYRYYPGDLPPTFEAALGAPVDGAVFDDGRVVVTGRAVDDVSVARVEVGLVDAAGRWMSSTGTFTSTAASWRSAFLTSPGSQGSNYSWTSPVVPVGTYSVQVRATDGHGFVSEPRAATGIVVRQPANQPPVARATASCAQNVCSFDARSSTDEDVAGLTYAWSFGTTSGPVVGGTGPVPVKTYATPGTFTATLTVTDRWRATSTTSLQVAVAEPAGNTAPVPTFTTGCLALSCSVSSTGTRDPDAGDVVAYRWDWGDGTAASTGATPSAHRYARTGTYVVTLTATDGWGRAASTTRTVVLAEPATNAPPVPTFTATCTGLVCRFDAAGTVDPQGDAVAYAWAWGNGTSTSGGATQTRTYAAAGTYTVVLTATDAWGRSATTSRQVTAG